MPERQRRIWVMGISGSGKTTLAKEIADRTGAPRLELDAVFWDANWTYRNIGDALDLVQGFIAVHPDAWVIDGNWSSRLGGLLDPGTAGGADFVVWLDHPRSVVMRRLVTRTVRRGMLREELWHGNRERPSTWLRLDPHQNILRWAWTRHATMRDDMGARMAAGWPVVRFTSQREVDAWLESFDTPPSATSQP